MSDPDSKQEVKARSKKNRDRQNEFKVHLMLKLERKQPTVV